MKALFQFKKKEIKEAFNHASFLAKTPGITLLKAPAKTHSKLLCITPRNIGTAVKRNQLRRRLKNIFYAEKLYEKPYIIILLAYKQATTMTYEQLKAFLKKHIESLDR